MKINTKVVFEWNDESKQYEEVYCESYDYDGEVAECQQDLIGTAGASYGTYLGMMATGGAMAAAAPWVAGAALISGISSGYAGHQSAERQKSYIRSQQSQLLKAGQSLEDLYGKKMGIYQEQFGEQLGQATYGAGESLFDVQQSGETLAGRTGLSYSGTVQRGLKRAREKVRKQFGFTKTGLENILGGQIMGLEEWKAGEEDRLRSEQERLSFELKQAEAASDWNPFT